METKSKYKCFPMARTELQTICERTKTRIEELRKRHVKALIAASRQQKVTRRWFRRFYGPFETLQETEARIAVKVELLRLKGEQQHARLRRLLAVCDLTTADVVYVKTSYADMFLRDGMDFNSWIKEISELEAVAARLNAAAEALDNEPGDSPPADSSV